MPQVPLALLALSFVQSSSPCVSFVHAYAHLLHRCVDVPVQHRSKRSLVQPLVILEGPNEPKHMGPYLELLLEEFKELGPTGGARRGTGQGCMQLHFTPVVRNRFWPDYHLTSAC